MLLESLRNGFEFMFFEVSVSGRSLENIKRACRSSNPRFKKLSVDSIATGMAVLAFWKVEQEVAPPTDLQIFVFWAASQNKPQTHNLVTKGTHVKSYAKTRPQTRVTK